MKCQNCGKHEVNVHYSSNINGHVTERYLCSECAEQLGYGYRSVFGKGFFDGFPFAEPKFPEIPALLGYMTPFRFTGIPQMGILMPNAAPQVPAPDAPPQNTEVDSDMQKRRELNILRDQMRKAAERDDFEKAIELRGKIQELEAQM